ncbi:MAG: DUF308 domain-containing protein [Lacunisphaera sp.]
MILVNGLSAVVFGLLVFAWPGTTLLVLVMLYGCFSLVDGISAVAAAFAHAKNEIWWEMLLVGLASIIAGVMAVLWPGLTGFALLMVIAVWSVVRGVLEIAAAIALRKIVRREGLLAAVGVASLLLGLVLLQRPGTGALAMAWVIGTVAVVRGGLLIGLALKLRKFQGAPAGGEFAS